MSEIRECDSDGFYEGEKCPDCGIVEDVVLSHDERLNLSKFVSGLLRHFNDEYGVILDDNGWASVDVVVSVVQDEKLPRATEREIMAISVMDPKGRFEVDGGKIRAAYGHSVDVTLETNDQPVPNVLYHGTAPGVVDDILSDGLKPMSRQFVHLTDDIADAMDVGSRHTSDPVLLKIDSQKMLQDGIEISKRGKNVYTVDFVPPEYIEYGN